MSILGIFLRIFVVIVVVATVINDISNKQQEHRTAQADTKSDSLHSQQVYSITTREKFLEKVCTSLKVPLRIGGKCYGTTHIMEVVTATILTICIEIRGENRVLPFPNSVELNIEVCIYILKWLEVMNAQN